MVFDAVGGDTQERAFQTLKRGGFLISTVSPPSAEKAQTHGVTVAMVVMTPNPETCSEDDTVEQVATALHEHDVSRLPVVRDGNLVGIVSRGDILKEIVKKGP